MVAGLLPILMAGLLPIMMAGLLPTMMAGIQAVASEVRVPREVEAVGSLEVLARKSQNITFSTLYFSILYCSEN